MRLTEEGWGMLFIAYYIVVPGVAFIFKDHLLAQIVIWVSAAPFAALALYGAYAMVRALAPLTVPLLRAVLRGVFKGILSQFNKGGFNDV